jgi:hypothetical protein
MTKWTNELSMQEKVPKPPATNLSATQHEIGITPLKSWIEIKRLNNKIRILFSLCFYRDA